MRGLFCTVAYLLILRVSLGADIETNKTDNVTSQPNSIDEIKKLEDVSQTLVASDEDEVKRSKKSTTTFCVEIRPSDSSQQPFQVCEPSDPAKSLPFSPPASTSYYQPTSYQVQELPKQHELYQTAQPNQPKPASAHSTATKTFPLHPPPALPVPPILPAPPKPYSSHVPLPYNNYRSKSDDNAERAQQHFHVMRMTAVSSEEDEQSPDSAANQKKRTANYGLSSYSNYGTPNSYLHVNPKIEKPKLKDHSGLVITCQPNLAGYAHNVPSNYHHPGETYSSYSYRSSTPSVYDRYDKYLNVPVAHPNGPSYNLPSRVPLQYPSSGISPHYSSSIPAPKYQQLIGPAFQQPTYQSHVRPGYRPSSRPPVYTLPPQTYAPDTPSQPTSVPAYMTPTISGTSSISGHSYTSPSQPTSGPFYTSSVTSETGSIPAPSYTSPSQPISGPIYTSSTTGTGSISHSSYAAPSQPTSGPIYTSHTTSAASSVPMSPYEIPMAPSRSISHSSYAAPSQPTSGPIYTSHTTSAASSVPVSPYEIPMAPSQEPQYTSDYGPSSSSSSASNSAAYGPPMPSTSVYSAPQYGFPQQGTGSSVQPQHPYIPPGTYRESENGMKMKGMSAANTSPENKEMQTLQRMEEVSHQRAADTSWKKEMSTGNTQKNVNEEHVQGASHGWSASMRTSEASNEIDKKVADMDKNKENEVDP